MRDEVMSKTKNPCQERGSAKSNAPAAYEELVIDRDNILAYARKISGESKYIALYKKLGASGLDKWRNASIDTIEFRYCDNTIYALTSGNGWRKIRCYCDPKFPPKIAARLLSENGMDDHSAKPLFGDVAALKQLNKNPQKINNLNGPLIYTTFTAKLRKNASIRHKADHTNRLTFSKNNEPNDINVEIKYGLVRFKTKIFHDEVDGIISNLNDIDKGRDTETTDRERERTSEVFKSIVHKCDQDTKLELDGKLLQNLEQCIRSRETDTLVDFDLMCVEMNDYILGNNYKLKFGGKSECLGKKPDLEEVMNIMSDRKNRKFRNIQSLKFSAQINKVYLVFDYKNTKFEKKLISIIEGMIIHDHHAYYRAYNNWFYMNSDYNRSIYESFVDILNNCCMDEGDPAALKRPWYANHEEKHYNKSYIKDLEFTVGDRLTIDSIELFDLMRCTDTSTHLYHVKRGFDQNARIAQAQLRDSAALVKNYYNNPIKTSLKDTYKVQTIFDYK